MRIGAHSASLEPWVENLRDLYARHEAKGEAGFFGISVGKVPTGRRHREQVTIQWRNSLTRETGRVAEISGGDLLSITGLLLQEMARLRESTAKKPTQHAIDRQGTAGKLRRRRRPTPMKAPEAVERMPWPLDYTKVDVELAFRSKA